MLRRIAALPPRTGSGRCWAQRNQGRPRQRGRRGGCRFCLPDRFANDTWRANAAGWGIASFSAKEGNLFLPYWYSGKSRNQGAPPQPDQTGPNLRTQLATDIYKYTGQYSSIDDLRANREPI